MMSEWGTVKVEDIAEVKSGKRLPKGHRLTDQITYYPYIRLVDISDGRIQEHNLQYLNEETRDSIKRYIVNTNDVCLAIVGHSIGMVFYVEEKWDNVNLTENAARITNVDESFNPRFIYYYLTSLEGQNEIISRKVGSAQGKLPLYNIRSLELPKIPRLIQDFIVSSLDSLSFKIELNRQTNQTLEHIAQAIFKSWFVDFEPTRAKIAAKQAGQDPERPAMAVISGKSLEALDQLSPEQQQQLKTTAALFPDALVDSELGEIPEGWEVKALDDIAHYQNGLALQKFRPKDADNFLPVLKIAQLKKGFADGMEKASPDIKPECIVDNGDVVFSWSGSLVVDVWCGGRVALNQHLFKVTSADYPKWFYCYWTKIHLNVFQQVAADKAVTMGHIKRSHLAEAKCTVPNVELSSFGMIGDFLEKQIEQRLESANLQDIRDLLLPKLLSGELGLLNIKGLASE